MNALREIVGSIPDRIGFAAFVYRWRILRQMVDLQSRLLIEQVLYEMGPPWSDLITGFKPIDMKGLKVKEYLAKASEGEREWFERTTEKHRKRRNL